MDGLEDIIPLHVRSWAAFVRAPQDIDRWRREGPSRQVGLPSAHAGGISGMGGAGFRRFKFLLLRPAGGVHFASGPSPPGPVRGSGDGGDRPGYSGQLLADYRVVSCRRRWILGGQQAALLPRRCGFRLRPSGGLCSDHRYLHAGPLAELAAGFRRRGGPVADLVEHARGQGIGSAAGPDLLDLRPDTLVHHPLCNYDPFTGVG